MKSFLHHLIIQIYKLAVRLNLFNLSALILARLTRELNQVKGYRVLCLNKTVFSEDLKALMSYTDTLNLLLFPRLLLSEYVRRHVRDFDQLNDGSYHERLGGTHEQDKILRDIRRLFPILLKKIKFDAIFAGNYVYVSQQEFFKVARENNIPVIVLYKEGMFPKAKYKSVDLSLFSSRLFIGDRILFYNDLIRNLLISANIPGLIYEKTTVVGVPRLDSYYVKKNKKSNILKNIVLFAFEPEVKAKNLLKNYNLLPRFIEKSNLFHLIFIQFAVNNPGFNVVIKIKSNPKAKDYIDNIISDYSPLPNNIQITSTEPAKNLITNSSIIAGYASTTLLEAMLFDLPIISPDFRDFPKDEILDYFYDYPQVVNYVSNYNTLKGLLINKKDVVVPSEEEKREILEPLLFSLDGKASERVETSIIKEITRIGS